MGVPVKKIWLLFTPEPVPNFVKVIWFDLNIVFWKVKPNSEKPSGVQREVYLWRVTAWRYWSVCKEQQKKEEEEEEEKEKEEAALGGKYPKLCSFRSHCNA